MSRRASFTQADYTRAIKGAIRGGLPVGSFKVVVENGELAILPVAQPDAPCANDDGGSWVDLAGTTQDYGRA